MNVALAALAVAIAAGGVVAVSAQDARFSVGGLAIAVIGSPLLGQAPDTGQVAIRVVGGLLAGYLLWISVRERPDVDEVVPAWPVTTLLALAAGLAGSSSSILEPPPGVDASVVGLPVAQGAAFALLVVAAVPVVSGRDPVRLGTGLVLAISSVALLGQGLGQPVPGVVHLAVAAVTVAVAGCALALNLLAEAPEVFDRRVLVGAHPIAEPGAISQGRPAVPVRSSLRGGLAEAVTRGRTRVRAVTVATGAVGFAAGTAIGSGASAARTRLGAARSSRGPMADRAKTGLGDVSARFSEAIAELHQTWLAWRGRSWTADDELDDAALSDGVVAHADATTPPQRSVTSADDGLSVGPGLPHGPSISARSAGARRVPPPDQ